MLQLCGCNQITSPDFSPINPDCDLLPAATQREPWMLLLCAHVHGFMVTENVGKVEAQIYTEYKVIHSYISGHFLIINSENN